MAGALAINVSDKAVLVRVRAWLDFERNVIMEMDVR